MTLPEKIIAVEALFQKLDDEIAQFQSWSSLHCQWGCGACCFKADIEATVLEFLPFADQLHARQQAINWLERLNTAGPICSILSPTQPGAGLCSEYPHRGLICRLFGYSARINKYGTKELVTCQIIKTGQHEAFLSADEKIKDDQTVPVMSDYYLQLHNIDADLSRDFFPINEAIRKAIEAVGHYYLYRDRGEG